MLFYKHLAVLAGHRDYEHHVNPTDALTESQRRYAAEQFERFCRWWAAWNTTATTDGCSGDRTVP